MKQKNFQLHILPIGLSGLAVFIAGTAVGLTSTTLNNGTHPVSLAASAKALTTVVLKLEPHRDGSDTVGFNVPKTKYNTPASLASKPGSIETAQELSSEVLLNVALNQVGSH